MTDSLKPATEAARVIADAVTGEGTPESVKVVQRDDRLAVWVKGLSGPAVSLMLMAAVMLTADWAPFFGKLGVWTQLTEPDRAKAVSGVALLLAFCIGVILWVAQVGRPSRTEITAGPIHIDVQQGDD